MDWCLVKYRIRLHDVVLNTPKDNLTFTLLNNYVTFSIEKNKHDSEYSYELNLSKQRYFAANFSVSCSM